MKYPPMTPGMLAFLKKREQEQNGSVPPLPPPPPPPIPPAAHPVYPFASPDTSDPADVQYPRVFPPPPSSQRLGDVSRPGNPYDLNAAPAPPPMDDQAGAGGGAGLPFGMVPPIPSSALQIGPVAPLNLRHTDHKYAPLPPAPTLGPAPVANLGVQGQQRGVGALVAGLAGALLTKNATGAVAAASGYANGAEQRQAEGNAADLNNWNRANQVTQANYAAARQGVNDQNQVTARAQAAETAGNNTELRRYATDTKAALDTAVANFKALRDQGADQRAIDKARADYSFALTKTLETLTPSAQAEELDRRSRSGELERFGVNFQQTDDGQWITNLKTVAQQNFETTRTDKQTATAATAATAADDKKRKAWSDALGRAYKDFADPRATKEGKGRAAQRINTLEGSDYLNLGDGENPLRASMIASMMPAQQAALNLQQQSLKQRQQAQADTNRWRSLSRADQLKAAKVRADAAVAKGDADVQQEYRKNITRLTTLSTLLAGTNTHSVQGVEREAAQAEANMLLDVNEQLVKSGKVRISKATAALYRGAADGGRSVASPLAVAPAARRVPAPVPPAKTVTPARPLPAGPRPGGKPAGSAPAKKSRFTILPD